MYTNVSCRDNRSHDTNNTTAMRHCYWLFTLARCARTLGRLIELVCVVCSFIHSVRVSAKDQRARHHNRQQHYVQACYASATVGFYVCVRHIFVGLLLSVECVCCVYVYTEIMHSIVYKYRLLGDFMGTLEWWRKKNHLFLAFYQSDQNYVET